jgi:hypothetical protein
MRHNIKVMGWADVGVAQGGGKCRAVVNTAVNLCCCNKLDFYLRTAGQLMNDKGFGRKWLWNNRGVKLEFTERD